jgi:hypothetical protein
MHQSDKQSSVAKNDLYIGEIAFVGRASSPSKLTPGRASPLLLQFRTLTVHWRATHLAIPDVCIAIRFVLFSVSRFIIELTDDLDLSSLDLNTLENPS